MPSEDGDHPRGVRVDLLDGSSAVEDPDEVVGGLAAKSSSRSPAPCGPAPGHATVVDGKLPCSVLGLELSTVGGRSGRDEVASSSVASTLVTRWLGGALIALGLLYVWLLFELTHHSCGPLEGRTSISQGPHPPLGPCGFHTARFFVLLSISALVVLVLVMIWLLVNRRARKDRS